MGFCLRWQLASVGSSLTHSTTFLFTGGANGFRAYTGFARLGSSKNEHATPLWRLFARRKCTICLIAATRLLISVHLVASRRTI